MLFVMFRIVTGALLFIVGVNLILTAGAYFRAPLWIMVVLFLVILLAVLTLAYLYGSRPTQAAAKGTATFIALVVLGAFAFSWLLHYAPARPDDAPYAVAVGAHARFGTPPAVLSDNNDIADFTPLSGPAYAVIIRQAASAAASAGTAVTLDLNSGGGNTTAAALAVKVLRDTSPPGGTVTRVPRYAICQSACVAIFLAGTTRVADPEAVLLFHREDIYDNKNPIKSFFRPMVRFFSTLEPFPLMADAITPYEPTGLPAYLRKHKALDQPWWSDPVDCYLSAAQIANAFPGVLSLTEPPRPTTVTVLPQDCSVPQLAELPPLPPQSALPPNLP